VLRAAVTSQALPGPLDLDTVALAVVALGSPFCTPLAQRQNGEWRVVDIGGGRVSDLPEGISATDLLRPLGRS